MDINGVKLEENEHLNDSELLSNIIEKQEELEDINNIQILEKEAKKYKGIHFMILIDFDS